jgi:hypothetical protein
VQVGGSRLDCAQPFEAAEAEEGAKKTVLRFSETAVPAGGQRVLAFGVARGRDAAAVPKSADDAQALRAKAEQYWTDAKLPYGRLAVPDPGVQALVDSAIRNIFQAREIKGGLPAFQVGPTCYRGLWVVDGSFILEAVKLKRRVLVCHVLRYSPFHVKLKEIVDSGVLGDVEKHLSAIVVITFNGTEYPDVVINGVYHFKWDMQHGTMAPV